MRTMKKHILLALSMIVLCACGGGDDGDAPEISKDYLNVTPNVQLLADGQSIDISITANCSWTITKDADWLTVSPMTGNNSQSVTITAGRNATGAERTAVLTVKGGSLSPKRVIVTQLKAAGTTPDTPDPNPDSNQEPNSGDNLPPN